MIKLDVIEARMHEKHITQAELAEKLDCTQPFCSLLLSGKKGFTIFMLFETLRALDLKLIDVIADDYKSYLK